MAKIAPVFAVMAALAGGTCSSSAAQPLTEQQARAVIAPWYGLFNVATRGDVKAAHEQVLTPDYPVVFRLFAERMLES